MQPLPVERGSDQARPATEAVSLESCQRLLFERMAAVLFVLVAAAVAVAYLQDFTYAGARMAIALTSTGLLGVCAFATALPWRLRCWIFAFTMAGGISALLYLGGFQGPNLLVAVAVGTVLVTSCLGVWPAIATLGLFVAGFVGVAAAFVNGHTVDETAYELDSVGNWARVGTTFVLLCVAGIFFVGQMLRRLGTSLQHTERLLAEAKVQARERVAAAEQRTRLEADLQQAQKFEALGRMAGGVAHDLNNLLVVILNNATWIGNVGDGEAKEAAREIEQAGERATKLARNLLLFGSQQASALEPIELDAVVAESVPLLRKMLPPGVQFVWKPGDAGHVRSCRSELDQVLMNLCLNARDAMPAGGTITLATSRRPWGRAAATADHVVLSVTDQGHGISEAVRPHIFEPFFTTKDRRKGTGLGLAVVHGIVKQHGGHIEVQSTVGKGSTFEVWLPAADAAAPTSRSSQPRRTASPAPDGGNPAAAPTAPRPKPSTVLVLEDDDKVRKIVTNVLRNAGHDVHAFALGRDLLEWCRKAGATADLLVTDVNLTEHNGIEIYQHARLLLPDLSCLVCSGSYANPVDPSFFLEPRHGRLDKPFRSADLLASVERLLESANEAR